MVFNLMKESIFSAQDFMEKTLNCQEYFTYYLLLMYKLFKSLWQRNMATLYLILNIFNDLKKRETPQPKVY